MRAKVGMQAIKNSPSPVKDQLQLRESRVGTSIPTFLHRGKGNKMEKC